MRPARPPRRSSPVTRFNPHPTRRPDATRAGSLGRLRRDAVSILIRPEGRMRRDRALNIQRKQGVSILIRPEGRMRPSALARVAGCLLFQSSSDPKAGCDSCNLVTDPDLQHVSILIRPEGRMRLLDVGFDPPLKRVSILIRPEGRMRRHHVRLLTFRKRNVSILIRPEGRMRPGPSRAER